MLVFSGFDGVFVFFRWFGMAMAMSKIVTWFSNFVFWQSLWPCGLWGIWIIF